MKDYDVLFILSYGQDSVTHYIGSINHHMARGLFIIILLTTAFLPSSAQDSKYKHINKLLAGPKKAHIEVDKEIFTGKARSTKV
jgi:hypothetical protein